MRAYPGGQTQKSAIISQVRDAIANETLFSTREDASNSLMAFVAGESDPRAFEQLLGVPGGLGLLADIGVGARMLDVRDAQAAAIAWLEAPSVAADLSSVPGLIVLWLLDETTRLGVGLDDPQVADILKEVGDLHRRQLAGETVTRADWANTRSRAIAVTDSVKEDRPTVACELLETLAWPPLTARTILVEAVRTFGEISTILVRQSSDMDDAERAEIRAAMESLFAETAEAREADPDNNFFPDIFAARLPELHDRFVTDLNRTNAANRDAIIDCANQAVVFMRAAPIA